ncbi:MAG: hypothetical protein MK077_03090 [Phycisphaerales bacterium]|nr:hypothetical protein [Phycisphaerales bacterium]
MLVFRLIMVVGSLLIGGFCLFGFLATFEPLDGSVMALRIVYVIVGVASVIFSAVQLITLCKGAFGGPED